MSALIAWLGADRKRRWWVLCLFLAALVVRVNWNLLVHPLDGFLYSDMRGYDGRADALLDHPFSSREYDAFFPFGTAWVLAAIKYVFGRDNYVVIGVIWAIFGASIVAACYAIADRVMGERVRWVAPAVGVFLVFYYPLIAIGGYVLSELPFSFCMTMSLLLLLRVVDEGRYRDALLLGFTLGCGCLIRSQLTASIALIGGYWLITRLLRPRPFAKLTWKHIVCVGIPLALLLGMSAVRFHIHTGRRGLVSENSTINLVFGRCHNKGIYSRPDGKGHGTVRFAPPPLIQFEAHSERHPESFFQIKSVWADHPEPFPEVDGFAVDGFGCRKRGCKLPGSEIEYKGYIGDGDIQMTIVEECVRRAGFKRQAYFTLSHWAMLWKYNRMWPDDANPKPRPKAKDEGWKALQQRWAKIHRGLLMIPALFGLFFALAPRRRPKEALVSLNLWALLVIAGIWLGGIRFRMPYDPIIVLLAGFSYGFLWEKLVVPRLRRFFPEWSSRWLPAPVGAPDADVADGPDAVEVEEPGSEPSEDPEDPDA
ncbi:glycosyltransferase family 39 protein [Pseudenhygromyxa sp. WMMC2535]|uniref:ArnT family glycosyltransferase n=1 Tax=Pseudenhygromyxa sp. WMMC2535 TaxID=2712867 RepID=UPI00155523DF|nr:phospholipid carrier-dependent glycosyltransferase [Pseudenhygromyxa sp. WMMC2535]NVB43275.1 glycosyltransferase family 39 protein [Pseudenhygromyxa sp. WMMC2535]